MPDAPSCSYCGVRRAVNKDHVIPKSVLRDYNRDRHIQRRPVAPFRHETVDACFECNTRKGQRRLVPPSWAHRLDDLNAVFSGTAFRVWDGGKIPDGVKR